MIIRCKNCSTQFKVNPNDIGNSGRMVSCSVCDYEWLHIIENNNYDIKPTSAHYKPKSFNAYKKSSIFSIIFICCFIIALSLFAILYVEREFLIKQHSIIENIYKVFGYHNINGLELKIMSPIKLIYDNKVANTKIQYEVPIKIINHNNKVKYLQAIKIIGFDSKNKKVINSLASLNKNISENSELYITLKTNSISKGMHHIIVKIGNIVDLKTFHPDYAKKDT